MPPMTRNTTSHTPGPWTAGPPAWFRGQRTSEDGKRPITAGPAGVVANVYGEGNARLIAAAPELLDLVRRMKTRALGDCQVYWDHDADQVLARVDGAGK
jgi:hypothetical protein